MMISTGFMACSIAKCAHGCLVAKASNPGQSRLKFVLERDFTGLASFHNIILRPECWSPLAGIFRRDCPAIEEDLNRSTNGVKSIITSGLRSTEAIFRQQFLRRNLEKPLRV